MATNTDRDGEIFREGTKLSDDAAKLLEEEISNHSSAIDSRIKLLGFYSGKLSKDHQQRWADQMIWMIRHCPESWIGGNIATPEHYATAVFVQVRDEWLAQVTCHPDNARILENAAKALSVRDFKAAESLFKRLCSVEPRSSAGWCGFTRLYTNQADRCCGRKKRTLATLAFAAGEKALKYADRRSTRMLLLMPLARIAFDTNELARAKKYAEWMLAIAIEMGVLYDRGLVPLGLIALKDGNIDEAKKRLSQLAKFGFSPDFSLADALLQAGEDRFVLAYLRKQRRRSDRHSNQIAEWIAELEHGKHPRLFKLKPF